MTERPVLIAAGGTGGHVFPANSLVEALIQRGHRVTVVTDARGNVFRELDQRVEVHLVRAGPLAGSIGRQLMGVTSLGIGLAQAARLLHRISPVAAIGFGGYASVPTMLAAGWLGVPTLIHEQNGVMGRANRFLASSAKMIALSLQNTGGLREDCLGKARITGNPVRDGIAALSHSKYRPSEIGGSFNLLVIGGSQGARIFSDVVPEAIALLPDLVRQRISVTQQCRSEDLDRVRTSFAASGLKPELAPFFVDMPAHLSAAHLVVARAGASTVAELAAAGRPAILVPYRHATDRHQHINAQALEDAGGAWLIPQDYFSPHVLATRIEDFLASPKSLAKAALHARTIGYPDATERLVDMVEELIGDCGGTNQRSIRPMYGWAA